MFVGDFPMRKFALVLALALTAASPALASDGPKCLASQFIDHTHVANISTVLFYMKDGKVWQNDLPAPCSGLQFHGFVIHGQESEICGGQGIRLIESGQVCILGRFSAYQAPAQ